jgi:hypothetical protein
MSYDSSVKITYRLSDASIVEMIESYLNHGWSLDNDAGRSVFEPLGATEPDELQVLPASAKKEILTILRQKETARERISLTMSWEKSATLGDFYFLQSTVHVFFHKGMGRRTIDGLDGTTDYSWYMPKLLLPLATVGGRVQKIQWTDIP